jgi:ferredoxin
LDCTTLHAITHVLRGGVICITHALRYIYHTFSAAQLRSNASHVRCHVMVHALHSYMCSAQRRYMHHICITLWYMCHICSAMPHIIQMPHQKLHHGMCIGCAYDGWTAIWHRGACITICRTRGTWHHTHMYVACSSVTL